MPHAAGAGAAVLGLQFSGCVAASVTVSSGCSGGAAVCLQAVPRLSVFWPLYVLSCVLLPVSLQRPRVVCCYILVSLLTIYTRGACMCVCVCTAGHACAAAGGMRWWERARAPTNAGPRAGGFLFRRSPPHPVLFIFLLFSFIFVYCYCPFWVFLFPTFII